MSGSKYQKLIVHSENRAGILYGNKFGSAASSLYECLCVGILEILIKYDSIKLKPYSKNIKSVFDQKYQPILDLSKTFSRQSEVNLFYKILESLSDSSQSLQNRMKLLEHYSDDKSSENLINMSALDYFMRLIFCFIIKGKLERQHKIMLGQDSQPVSSILQELAKMFNIKIIVINKNETVEEYCDSSPGQYPILYCAKNHAEFTLLYTEEMADTHFDGKKLENMPFLYNSQILPINNNQKNLGLQKENIDSINFHSQASHMISIMAEFIEQNYYYNQKIVNNAKTLLNTFPELKTYESIIRLAKMNPLMNTSPSLKSEVLVVHQNDSKMKSSLGKLSHLENNSMNPDKNLKENNEKFFTVKSQYNQDSYESQNDRTGSSINKFYPSHDLDEQTAIEEEKFNLYSIEKIKFYKCFICKTTKHEDDFAFSIVICHKNGCVICKECRVMNVDECIICNRQYTDYEYEFLLVVKTAKDNDQD